MKEVGIKSAADVLGLVELITLKTNCGWTDGKQSEVQRENTPYSSLEPNESDIVNRQSGGEKLKYVLKFYIGGTYHDRRQRTTNKNNLWRVKWSRDQWRHVTQKGRGHDPNIIRAHYLDNSWRHRLIDWLWLQWNSYRKLHLENQMVKWPMIWCRH